MYKNGKLGSLWGSTLPRIRITSRKASNKNCLELNFVQKSQWDHMSVSHRGGTRGFSIFVHYKISNVLIFGVPNSTRGGGRHMCSRTFCTKFNSEQLLFEPFFDVMHIFGSAEP